MPSTTTLPLLEVNVRSALLGVLIVDPLIVRSPVLPPPPALASTYAFIDCCVAKAVSESELNFRKAGNRGVYKGGMQFKTQGTEKGGK